MTKHSNDKQKRTKVDPSGAVATTASTAAAPTLGVKRGPRARPEKLSARQQSALDKKAARARWDERMTSQGR